STQTSFDYNAVAESAARSGLTEALQWFKRQTTQPVRDFEPRLDPKADPPLLDTEDESIGLVREFEITGRRVARYEIWKPSSTSEPQQRAQWRAQMQVRDVSVPRSTAEGCTWRLRSVGYVYERWDDSVPFDQSPNRVIAQRILEMEVTRSNLTLPGLAALAVSDGNGAHVNTYGRIEGGVGAGIYYPRGSGQPTTGPTNQRRVTGNPGLSPADDVDVSTETVFGMTYQELKGRAEHIVTNPADFPVPVPDGAIVLVECSSITFDAPRPLRGRGIVYVRGNASIAQGSNSYFQGLLYVDGSLTMRAPALIEGAIVLTGNLSLQGSGDYATMRFDKEVIDRLRYEFGAYAQLGAIRDLYPQ